MPKRTKTSYNQQLLKLVDQYEAVHPSEAGFEKEAVYRWARDNGLWEPHEHDEAKIFMRELGEALRSYQRVDSSGRPHRGKLSYTVSRNGKQTTLWGDSDRLARPYVQKNVAERRKQIVGDCFSLKMTVDHFNDTHPQEVPIQTEFDFTADVEEKTLELHRKNAA